MTNGIARRSCSHRASSREGPGWDWPILSIRQANAWHRSGSFQIVSHQTVEPQDKAGASAADFVLKTLEMVAFEPRVSDFPSEHGRPIIKLVLTVGLKLRVTIAS